MIAPLKTPPASTLATRQTSWPVFEPRGQPARRLADTNIAATARATARDATQPLTLLGIPPDQHQRRAETLPPAVSPAEYNGHEIALSALQDQSDAAQSYLHATIGPNG